MKKFRSGFVSLIGRPNVGKSTLFNALAGEKIAIVKDTPGSHRGKGWEEFTDAAIKALADKRENLVFILWGAYAQKKGAFIDCSRHLVIESAPPSPLSARRGFFGSQPFSKANAYLNEKNITPIIW